MFPLEHFLIATSPHLEHLVVQEERTPFYRAELPLLVKRMAEFHQPGVVCGDYATRFSALLIDGN